MSGHQRFRFRDCFASACLRTTSIDLYAAPLAAIVQARCDMVVACAGLPSDRWQSPSSVGYIATNIPEVRRWSCLSNSASVALSSCCAMADAVALLSMSGDLEDSSIRPTREMSIPIEKPTTATPSDTQ